ncbi:MAG: DUF1194 domain-containing protein [Pseudomonadota bacterium]
MGLSLLRWIAAATLLVAACEFTHAQQKVDLQLVLAVDASGSVNMTRFELQKKGYAEAFRNPRVLDSIRSGSTGSIAVTMIQWTGPLQQVVVVPWTLIKDRQSADEFAAAIEKAPRQLFSGGTSISGAIDFSASLMPSNLFAGLKRVIDVSGDGSNNNGRPVTETRDDAVAKGIVVNGLPILSLEPTLDRYYYDNVIGGAGSFMVPAKSYETFAAAVLRKLILEIAVKPSEVVFE